MSPGWQPSRNESTAISRRQMLARTGTGFGLLPLVDLLARQSSAANPLSPRVAHRPGKAQSCIFLFMEGGPSHIDLVDPKPALERMAGRPLPASFPRVITAMGEMESPVLASRRRWHQYGAGGLWFSDWLPHTAECADWLTVVKSCWTNGINHSGGVCQMNTGSPIPGRPCLGSWVTYGLGSENENLPAFVVMQDNPSQVVNGPRNWSMGFMPAVYQGTSLQGEGAPLRNLALPATTEPAARRRQLDLLRQWNQRYADGHPDHTELEARINSYELAYRMQATAPEAVDLSQETESTRRLYGLDEPRTASFGRLCLLARRMVERGVRFVQLYHGAGSKWDAHSGIEKNHTEMCGQSDLPVAGLLKDLRQRGLLDSTLVVWGGEFGRTPMSEKGNGRDHNPTGFSMWLSGAGLAGGRAIGATDEAGLHAVQDRLHVRDLHATILHLMGLDPDQLIYVYKGRPEKATMNEGVVSRAILGT